MFVGQLDGPIDTDLGQIYGQGAPRVLVADSGQGSASISFRDEERHPFFPLVMRDFLSALLGFAFAQGCAKLLSLSKFGCGSFYAAFGALLRLSAGFGGSVLNKPVGRSVAFYQTGHISAHFSPSSKREQVFVTLPEVNSTCLNICNLSTVSPVRFRVQPPLVKFLVISLLREWNKISAHFSAQVVADGGYFGTEREGAAWG